MGSSAWPPREHPGWAPQWAGEWHASRVLALPFPSEFGCLWWSSKNHQCSRNGKYLAWHAYAKGSIVCLDFCNYSYRRAMYIIYSNQSCRITFINLMKLILYKIGFLWRCWGRRTGEAEYLRCDIIQLPIWDCYSCPAIRRPWCIHVEVEVWHQAVYDPTIFRTIIHVKIICPSLRACDIMAC